jgi:integrase/recombinase XerD
MKKGLVSVYLDKRREKKNGKFPLKIMVYNPIAKSNKRYNTIFDLTEKEFESIWISSKPRNEYKDIRRKIQTLEDLANDIVSGLNPFTFEEFEKRFYRKSGDSENVFYHYREIIEGLTQNEQIGTASNYELSLKSIKDYLVYRNGKEPKALLFSEITPKWLEGYEKFMTNKPKERSLTTVSMYVRALRAVFNKAIDEKDIDKDIYPFGKRKYQVPAVKNVKKALTSPELKQLFEAEPFTPEQAKAKDFWFFSYSCNGINIKDIALLRNKNIEGDKIIYYRAKTIKTAKSDLKPIVVYLTNYSQSIIEKYRTQSTDPDSLLFEILNDNQNPDKQQRSIKNFTKFINQNLKKLSEKIGLTGNISTYWARHSFATNAIRKGASMEYVSEALNHSNLKITQGYFSGFEDKTKKELQANLMDF